MIRDPRHQHCFACCLTRLTEHVYNRLSFGNDVARRAARNRCRLRTVRHVELHEHHELSCVHQRSRRVYGGAEFIGTTSTNERTRRATHAGKSSGNTVPNDNRGNITSHDKFSQFIVRGIIRTNQFLGVDAGGAHGASPQLHLPFMFERRALGS